MPGELPGTNDSALYYTNVLFFNGKLLTRFSFQATLKDSSSDTRHQPTVK